MNSTYDDVEKLLSHMHMKDFSYRSFRHDGSTPPLRVVRPKEEPQSVAKVEVAPKQDAVQPKVEPQPAPKVEALAKRELTLTEPALAAPVALAQPEIAAKAPAAAATASSRVGDALERLMRGSIADHAPKVNLHLELPLRPGPQQAVLATLVADPPISEVFRRLNALALLPPKIVVREER
jgi:hypothetical protein